MNSFCESFDKLIAYGKSDREITSIKCWISIIAHQKQFSVSPGRIFQFQNESQCIRLFYVSLEKLNNTASTEKANQQNNKQTKDKEKKKG